MLGNFSFSVAEDTIEKYVKLYGIDDLIYHLIRFISNYEIMIGVQYIFLSDILVGFKILLHYTLVALYREEYLLLEKLMVAQLVKNLKVHHHVHESLSLDLSRAR